MDYKMIYFNAVSSIYHDHGNDMEATIAYMSKNFERLCRTRPDFKEAKKVLTADERNDVIEMVICLA